MSAALQDRYVIAGGRPGRDRLRVLSSALDATTSAFLRRAEVARASRIVDLGCGGGDVTLTLAAMAPHALVLGIDADPIVVDIARAEAAERGVSNVRYEVADATEVDLGASRYDLVYARFLLSHLPDPVVMLGRMVSALRPGGTLAVEDVDIPAAVSAPELAAFRRVNELVSAAMRRRGGDPELGRHLAVLLHGCGLVDVRVQGVQPGGLTGDAKQLQLRTLEATSDSLVSLGLADAAEIDALTAELAAFVARTDTFATTARVFQCLGRRVAAARPHPG